LIHDKEEIMNKDTQNLIVETLARFSGALDLILDLLPNPGEAGKWGERVEKEYRELKEDYVSLLIDAERRLSEEGGDVGLRASLLAEAGRVGQGVRPRPEIADVYDRAATLMGTQLIDWTQGPFRRESRLNLIRKSLENKTKEVQGGDHE